MINWYLSGTRIKGGVLNIDNNMSLIQRKEDEKES